MRTLVTVSPGEGGGGRGWGSLSMMVWGDEEEDICLGSWKNCMGQEKKECPVGFCVVNRGCPPLIAMDSSGTFIYCFSYLSLKQSWDH